MTSVPKVEERPLDDTEFLAATQHAIGMIYLSRHQRASDEGGWVYDVHIDGDLLMSSISPLSERELATQAIMSHPGKKLRVLIGGLGLGYTALAAAESDRVSLIRVVDRMDFVIQWMNEGLLPLSDTMATDDRVEFVLSDVYADLLGPASETYDLILVDVDHAPHMPLDPASLPFYTEEGQAAVAKHLAPGGILAVWSAFHNQPFLNVLEASYIAAWRSTIDWIVPHNDCEDQRFRNTLFFGRKA